MREFEADPLTKVHPQTVIERFGTWNAAKRKAGLVPRRFATRADLLDALHGRITDHHRFMIKLHLTQIDTLETAVATIEAHIGAALGPFRPAVSLLTTMPGLSETTARVLIAEIGTDMTRFPSAGHLISWAGLCPRLNESAGKRRSTRTRQSAPWLKPTLINAAWAATRKKDSYLRAQFLRIKSRRGAKLADHPDLFTGLFWSGLRGLDLGLVDRLGDLRTVLRDHYGETVKLQLIGQKRGLFGLRGGAGASRFTGGATLQDVGATLASGLVDAAEERALWARYGL